MMLFELLLVDVKILDMSLSLVWDNLSGDMVDFLLAAAEHTKAAPVGLHVSDTTLKNGKYLVKSPKNHLARSHVARNQSYDAQSFQLRRPKF